MKLFSVSNPWGHGNTRNWETMDISSCVQQKKTIFKTDLTAQSKSVPRPENKCLSAWKILVLQSQIVRSCRWQGPWFPLGALLWGFTTRWEWTFFSTAVCLVWEYGNSVSLSRVIHIIWNSFFTKSFMAFLQKHLPFTGTNKLSFQHLAVSLQSPSDYALIFSYGCVLSPQLGIGWSHICFCLWPGSDHVHQQLMLLWASEFSFLKQKLNYLLYKILEVQHFAKCSRAFKTCTQNSSYRLLKEDGNTSCLDLSFRYYKDMRGIRVIWRERD